MSELRRTPVKIGGRKGIYIHDKLCSDGPVDEVTGQPLIDPATGKPYRGPNDDMADLIHEYLVKIRADMNLSGNISQTVPRFGVLSLIARNTPIYVYDHPAFKEIANTAFTDGINVFIDADFMRKLWQQEIDSDGKYSGVIFLVMHELMHKLYYHVDRLKKFPPRIANIAEDMVINGKLVKGFTMLKPVKLLAEIGHGMKSEEADKYFSMAEEVVAEMLLIQERKKKQKQQQDKQKQKGGAGNQQGSGSGSPGGEGDDSDEDDEDQDQNNNNQDQEQEEKNGKGKSNQSDDMEAEEDEEYSPIHHITPEELLKVIEKNGLKGVAEALDLPKSDDVEGIAKKKAEAKMQTVDAVQRAISEAARCDGKYPGGHIAEEAAELIGGLEKGKINWKLAIKKHIMGDGQKLYHSDDEAAITWLLDEETTGVAPFYSGASIPQAPDETVLVLVDTSGSTSGGNMRKEFLQEALGLKRGVSSASDAARKVIILSADTTIRGETLEITDYNVEKLRHEGVPIFGNGGTDFKRCLNEALDLPIMKKEKVKSVIYFTDCCDNPPTRADFEQHLEKGIKIVFVTTPGMWDEKWNHAVSDWAEVYCIEEGTVANLDKEEINADTRRNNMR